MTILDEIVADKLLEVKRAKEKISALELETCTEFSRATYSLRAASSRPKASGVIAEIKRRSPSKGTFKQMVSIPELSTGYVKAGASALSILTDGKYFGGSNDDLIAARTCNQCPILRKDFVVDEYQIVEAKAIGADLILLIAATLTPTQIQQFSKLARTLRLEVLLEVHSLDELQRSVCPEVDFIGVNSRDLRDFSVDVQRAYEIADSIPQDFIRVAESGISDVETIRTLRTKGFRGFLIGEAFMAQPDPAAACAEFISKM